MPGEKGDEIESPQSGYGEKLYRSQGDDPPLDPDSQSSLPNSKMIMNVLKLVRCQDRNSIPE